MVASIINARRQNMIFQIYPAENNEKQVMDLAGSLETIVIW
jgi:hypothetical protein